MRVMVGTTLEASEGMLVSCVVPPETTLMIRGCGSLYVLGIFHTVCFTFSKHNTQTPPNYLFALHCTKYSGNARRNDPVIVK